MTSHSNQNSFHARQTLTVNGKNYDYFSLKAAEQNGLSGLERLPFSLKILLENLLRHEDGHTVNKTDIQAMVEWLKTQHSTHEIAYHPARVLMQDFTGVPAVADLAAMRDATKETGGDPEDINPLCPIDLVIDHSVQVDEFGTQQAFTRNVTIEMERNKERYNFLRWGQKAFKNFRVVPPGTGICHQVNLECLAKVAWTSEQADQNLVYPDTLVGTDSHTTMINGLGVLGWGVGGIEAEAATLGQPISMRIPEVVGFKLAGRLPEGITATDLVLTITQMLRQEGVVGKFVEFYGPGIIHLPLAQRATISNMAPEYGATCGLFPIDAETINYLHLTGRSEQEIALVEAYAKAQGFWHDDEQQAQEPLFTKTLTLNLSEIEPSLAGPKRPQDRVSLAQLPQAFDQMLRDEQREDEKTQAFEVEGEEYTLSHGDLVIAAITSCTNTSNPRVLMMSGLLAQKAIKKGLSTRPWVKASLAPGSKVVTDYLQKAGLMPFLEQLGFYLVGYGCTTCIGNSGPLATPIEKTITDNHLFVSAVLSGNRNFEGRIHPFVKANWLASPPLVVAYALVGTTKIDLSNDALGQDANGQPVYLKDIWPSNEEVEAAMVHVAKDMFTSEYADVFTGDEDWRALPIPESTTYAWDDQSTYVKRPPFFDQMPTEPGAPTDIENARILAVLGDSVTTDHISPAGSIAPDSPAGKYLQEQGVTPLHFNSYGARRGNHEVMIRGTFANIRIRNQMVPGTEGGFTKHPETGEVVSIYEAAMHHQQNNTPLVVFAGKEYGTGSSRDWAAKGTLLLGVKAVIAESFERIHRSNLIGMGVLPLCFKADHSHKSLNLTGDETITIQGLAQGITPRMALSMHISDPQGRQEVVPLDCAIETEDEVDYYTNGGILQYVLRQQAKK